MEYKTFNNVMKNNKTGVKFLTDNIVQIISNIQFQDNEQFKKFLIIKTAIKLN